MIVLSVSACLAAALGQDAMSDNGSISGRIVDENGNGVGGAQVVFRRQTTFRRSTDGRATISQPGTYSAITADLGGGFAVSNLSAGNYHVCGFGSKAVQISSCDWSGVPTITLDAGKQVTGITREVSNGALVTLNVFDPNNRLATGQKFYVGLGDSLYYQRAVESAKSAQGRTFSIGVPRQRKLRLFIDTDDSVKVVDSGGAVLDVGRLTSEFLVPDTEVSVTLNLRIL